MAMPGTHKENGETANIAIYIRDLIQKEYISEEDLMIIEDAQNTKCCLVRDFLRSAIKDNDVPTEYRIYSSLKIQTMIDELKTFLEKGVGQVQDLVKKLDGKKADRTELEELEESLLAIINDKGDTTIIMEILESKRDKNVKIKRSDMDTSSDEAKLGLENLSKEVLDAMTGGTAIPSNRPPKGGWVTEDLADAAVNRTKLSDTYSYGGHFIEGNINDFVKTGCYTLGPDVLGLPKNEDDEEDDSELRLLFVDATDNDIIKQRVEYINDLKYRPIYRRTATRTRLRVTEFTKVEEINDKFKAHRDILSDDFANCGDLSGVDLFTITREGHYYCDNTVTNLPTNDAYEVEIRKFGDRIIYWATNMGESRCDVYQALQYYTTGENPVTTQWYNTSNFSRSKFEGKTVHLFGDGILFGLGSDDISNKSIPALLSNKYGMRIINNSLGDATVASYDDETLAERSVVTQVKLSVMDDADYAIILVGTHDWDSAKSTLGAVENVSEYSYMGGLNTAIQTIYAKNPNIKVLLVTPFFRSRIKVGDGKNSDDNAYNDLMLEQFADAMVDVADLNHIPCLNLYKTSGINKFNSDSYLSDGLYPNDAGHKMIADKIVDAMNNFY